MTDIQQARDVLAKWRGATYETAWEVDTNEPFSNDLVGLFVEADHEYAVKFDPNDPTHVSTARLIVGTAGNPELLDAIDGFLAVTVDGVAQGFKSYPGYSYAERIAAAIIAADERMSA